MNFTLIGREKNDVSFKMDFAAKDFEDAVNKAYQAKRGQYAIDGFRKGKAPKSLIEAKYGDDIFFEDAINQLFADSYPKALEELSIDSVDRPTADFDKIEKGQGFSVTVKVTASPVFEINNYKGVKVAKIDTLISEGDIQKDLEGLQKRNSRMILVDRPAKDGDTVLIDYAGFVGEDQFDGGTAERQPLVLGSNTFIPGFEEQLIGATVGEEKDVFVTFPEEYHSTELAGKDAVFKCMVHEIKETELPEIDDEFAKDVSEFETLVELQNDTREKLEKTAKDKAEYELKNAIIEKVYEANEIDIPDAMVEDQIDEMLREFDQQLKYQGLGLEQYYEYLNKNAQDFRQEMKPDAFKKVKTRLLVDAVAKAENLTASDEEVDLELSAMAEQYKMETKNLKEMMGAEGIFHLINDIKNRKAVDFMFENAQIES